MNKFISEVTNEDCMEGMARYPDKYFDLAIVDPPYGIGKAKTQTLTDEYISNGKGSNFKIKQYKEKNWDNKIPPNEYWNQLFRVSKNQIVWGANYFIKYLPHLKNFIYWHKKGKGSDKMFNEGEIAFVSFGRSVMVDIWWNGVGVVHSGENRTHPTQKPVALYKWLLDKYAKQGDKILDTHLGSGSSRIAAYEMGFDFTAFELDTEYYEAQEKRYNAHIAQLKLELI